MLTRGAGVYYTRVDLSKSIVPNLQLLHSSGSHVLDAVTELASTADFFSEHPHTTSAPFTRSRKISLPFSCFRLRAKDLLFLFTAANRFDMGPASGFHAASSPAGFQYLESS